MRQPAETARPKVVNGAEAERVKRDALGIAGRRKHHARKATPLKGHAKEADAHHRSYRFRFYPTTASRAAGEDLRRLPVGLQPGPDLAIRGMGTPPGEGRVRGNVPRADRLEAGRRDDLAQRGVVDRAPTVAAPCRPGLHTFPERPVEVPRAEEEGKVAGLCDLRAYRLQVGRGPGPPRDRADHARQAVRATAHPLVTGAASGRGPDPPVGHARQSRTVLRITTRLVRENQVLVVEDLSIVTLLRPAHGKGRRRKARLNEAIIDAGWGELLRQLQYKCAWYGRTLVIVIGSSLRLDCALRAARRGRRWTFRYGSGLAPFAERSMIET